MTKKELETKINFELTSSEIAFVNTNIYWNDKYIDYYMNYKCGEFKKCLDFLMKNRDLLTIKHTPDEWKPIVKVYVNNTKKY